MKKRISGLVVLILILLIGLVGCKGGKETAHETHEFGEWKVTRKASCTEPGVETRTCECGEKETRKIPAVGHTVEKIEAVEPTCTTQGKTEGTKCSVCDLVLSGGEVLPEAHKEVTIKAIAVTCTRAGKTAGSKCSICGEIVKRQKKIRATGHNYEGDSCTKCGKHLPDIAVALLVDQFNEYGPANFVTKEAYPGGTTLSFSVCLPNTEKAASNWWGIGWTKNPAKASVYDWSEDGSGVLLHAKPGEWQDVSMTVPEDGQKYYLFLVAVVGQWSGEPILIDDATITDQNGKVIGTDNFDYGVDAGLFNAEKVNAGSGTAAVYAYERCQGHKEVTDAAVAATCDEAGKTAGSHCSVCGKALVKQEEIPALGHKWNENDVCKTCGKEREDLVAVLVIDKLKADAPMNFITKEAYPGGSTVTFQAFVPKANKPDGNPTWWGICFTTDTSDASVYNCFESGKGQAYNADSGEWKEYTVTLPNDGKEYYIYFGGAIGEWNGKEIEINDFTVTSSTGSILAEESFDDGVENGIFDVIATDMNSGESVVYDRVFKLPCSDGHTVVTLSGKEADCTNPGLTEGSYCSVCGAVLVAQEEIPATGHKYDETTGQCVCGEMLKNRAVAINVDAINDYSNMNFMTRQAYAGGSTISFKAYVPSGTAWWAISYTTDPTVGDLYAWAEKGYGAAQNSTYDTWKEYSFTLPDDENTYYFYIVGEKGQWGGKELLIDDVKITNKFGETVAEDDFNAGMHSGIFKIVELNSNNEVAIREVILGEACTHPESKWHKDNDIKATCTDSGIIGATRCECGEVIIPEEVVPALGHDFVNGICDVCGEAETDEPVVTEDKAAKLYFGKFHEALVNFVTKETYPGGSTVTFEAYVPEGITGSDWWGTSAVTSTSGKDVYGCAGENALTSQMQVGEWATYTVTLPSGNENYYFAIGGCPGPNSNWANNALIVDNVKVTSADGTVLAEEDFSAGFADSIFAVDETGFDYATGASATGVELVTVESDEVPDEPIVPDEPVVTEDKAAKLYFGKFHEALVNFVTKETYPGGSTVTFEAYVPEGITGSDWWGTSAVTSTSGKDVYGCAGENALTSQMQVGEWATYTVTLPSGNENYYFAIGGCPGPNSNWANNALLVDNVKVTSADGTVLAEEDFSAGFADSIFAVNETGFDYATGASATGVELVTVERDEVPDEPVVTENKAVALNIDGLVDEKTMSFITKDAYAGGSTISFQAFVPAGTSWWAISYTTDTEQTNLYKWTEGLGASQSSTYDAWKEYSLTLPDDGNDYYIYIVGAKGEWGGKELLIDDVKIVGKDGVELATEDFNGGLANSIFTYIEAGWTNTGENVTVVREYVIEGSCSHTNTAKDNDILPTCTDTGITGRTYCVDCGETLIEEEVVPALGHEYEDGVCGVCGTKEPDKAAAITINKMGSDTGKMSFITKEAYPAGGKVTFDILIPENISNKWWGIGFATSPSSADLYAWCNGTQYGQTLNATIGEWTTITVDIPSGYGDQYIYLVAAVGEWPAPDAGAEDTVFLIDNVVIEDAGGNTVVTETFKEGFGIFNAEEQNSNGETVVSLYEMPAAEETNKAAQINIGSINEAPFNFITKDAYPGGSTVTFDAFVPAGVESSWWGLAPMTTPNAVDIYACAGANALTSQGKAGEWAQITVTLPNDGQNYYLGIGGPCGSGSAWYGKSLLVDNFKVCDANGTVLAEDDFNEGFENGLFNVTTTGLGGEIAVELYEVPAEVEANKAAQINIGSINEAPFNFITKDAYPGGSTVTFDAFVPAGVESSWWGLAPMTNPNGVDIYACAGANALTSQGKAGEWAQITVTLPNDGQNYYLGIAGPCGSGSAWYGKSLLVDNFKVCDANGTVLAEDNFNEGFADGLFNVTTAGLGGEIAVELYTIPEE